MRSRLLYTLAAWLLSAVALSVVAMAGFTAWNLRDGFTAYLQARDIERLERFVGLLATRLERQPELLTNTAERLDMPGLLRELAVAEGVTPTPPAQPSQPSSPSSPYPRPLAEERGPGMAERPGPPRRQPRMVEGFGSRVSVARRDGSHWAGPRLLNGEPPVAEREVLVQGQHVATARLRAMARAPETTERQFLRSQYLGIAGIAAALLLMAGGGALWLSRQWLRPITAMQTATARIAAGEFAVRMPVMRSDELGELMQNVNHMAESLERMEGARRRWLADLSHELRTPLTVLQGEIEALADGVRPLDASAVGSLHDDVRRITRLVNDLHLLAMADLKALPCRWADADASQIFERVLLRMAKPAAAAGLALRGPSVTTGATPPLAVTWDALRIEQLLDNLLQNSLRYTDAPGCIQVSWAAHGQQVELTVDDSAPAVAEAELQRLFEPLYRADAARQRSGVGSGLGLAISAAIVQAHGGRIVAEPSALGGLRIRVVLPLEADLQESA